MTRRREGDSQYLSGAAVGAKDQIRTAYEHARVWAQLQARGKMIGAYDLIVAATALERRSEVATFNKRHFDLVPGLQVLKLH